MGGEGGEYKKRGGRKLGAVGRQCVWRGWRKEENKSEEGWMVIVKEDPWTDQWVDLNRKGGCATRIKGTCV